MNPIKHIEIPKPCTQQWQDMTPDGNGRYCSSCAKIVVDFSGMTADQIVGYLSANSHACGKFSANRLDAVNAHLLRSSLHKISGLKRWGIAVGLLTSLGYFKAEAKPKVSAIQTADNTSRKKLVNENRASALADSTRKISGIIRDEENVPIPSVSIQIVGTHQGTQTDIAGKFILDLPLSTNTIKVQFVGYETQTIDVNSPGFTNIGEIQLKLSPTILGELVVYKRPNVFKRTLHWLTGK